jgi:hypothetical protein
MNGDDTAVRHARIDPAVADYVGAGNHEARRGDKHASPADIEVNRFANLDSHVPQCLANNAPCPEHHLPADVRPPQSHHEVSLRPGAREQCASRGVKLEAELDLDLVGPLGEIPSSRSNSLRHLPDGGHGAIESSGRPGGKILR